MQDVQAGVSCFWLVLSGISWYLLVSIPIGTYDHHMNLFFAQELHNVHPLNLTIWRHRTKKRLYPPGNSSCGNKSFRVSGFHVTLRSAFTCQKPTIHSRSIVDVIFWSGFFQGISTSFCFPQHACRSSVWNGFLKTPMAFPETFRLGNMVWERQDSPWAAFRSQVEVTPGLGQFYIVTCPSCPHTHTSLICICI